MYVTKYLHQADWLLYMVKYSYESKKPGCWHIVKYPHQADIKVYVVKYPFQANKRVYFVSNKSKIKFNE